MLPYSEMSSIATSGAFVSKVDPSLYPQLYAAVKAGEVACTGSFKKNMKDLSIDVFIDELSRKTPIAKIEREGEDWVLNYIEEEDARRVEQFNKYIDEQEKK